MKKIITSKKDVCLIDKEDFDVVSKHKWKSTKPKKIIYVTRVIRDGKKYRTIYLHRFLMKAVKGQVVDHINGNGLDNRKENLRLCTQQQNTFNSMSKRKNKRFKGVYKWKDKFFAKLNVRKKVHYSKMYHTEEEAAKAHDKLAEIHYKEFAKKNI